ncbi:ABC transporter ATP-binding protein [Desulforapulum autotrophicum]|uniref:ABC transporter ATP-binding protein n=1 Tax=Desulforapulum autotrophicum TaxID=2296 RepID=UPI000317EA38|nr:ABC transporter ATP-binding protein [Desulforapulum autotrophicum]
MLLELDNITAGYGKAPILHDICLNLDKGEIVCIIGPNGAGKSTVLRTVAGQLQPSRGTMAFKGRDLTCLSIAQRGRKGLIFIPQGMNIFPNLTVIENLEIAGALMKDSRALNAAVKEILQHYPMLDKKKNAFGRTLSGGERQVLALSRTRMLKPDLVLLDEPSLGLAPLVVDFIFDEIKEMGKGGSSVLLVEQNARKGLSVSHRGYVLELGRNRLTGTGAELLQSDEVRRLYLGG